MNSTRTIQIKFAFSEAILANMQIVANIQIQFAYSEAVLTKGCLELTDEALEFRWAKKEKENCMAFLLYDSKL
jgi:hypothetical protein